MGKNRSAYVPSGYDTTEASTYFCDRKWDGFHILARLDDTGLRWRMFRDAQNKSSIDIEIPDHDPGVFTKRIREELRMKPIEYYQNEVGIFTLDGNRATRASLRREDSYTLFVTEVGVWMWPPVRVGFRQDTG